MTLLTAEKLCRRFDDQVVLDNVSFSVTSADRIGLLGRNGCGKTTLFEIVTGRMPTDNGSVYLSKSVRIDYVRQEISEHLEETIFDYVASARQDILDMRVLLADTEHRLEQDPHDKELLEQLGIIQEHYQVAGGFELDHQIEAILVGLGFEPDRHHDRLSNFSGGEKNRASLARVLAGNGQLMLLDEPTNHLDIESTRWLEDFMQGTDRAYIVVSHDRAFLNNVVKKVWELIHARLEFYVGGVDKYVEERGERRRLHEHRLRHQQQHIKKIEEFVRRNMAGQKTKQAQSRLKYLNRIKRLPPVRSDGDKAKIRMESSGRSFAHVLSLKNVSVGYGSRAVVEGMDIDLYRGDKIGLIGRNGSGKTTLLKSLLGELSPIKGEISLGNKVDVAYFDQELVDLDWGITVLDSIWEIDPMAESSRMRSFLARFGFTGEDPFKTVGSLSGGEKTRLSLARLLYHPANFIIFDEPTNHLDMDSREALEEALIEYDGSCLIVSHDRHFLDRVVTQIFHLDKGHLTRYLGNYSDFRRKTESQQDISAPRPVKSKEAYLAFKEKSRQRGKLKKETVRTRELIASLESEIVQLETDIDSGIPPSDWAALHKASDRKIQAESELIEAWANLEELEETEID